jgi:hemerythrin-like domain-containing protein
MKRHKSLHPLSHQHHNGLALCVMTLRALDADAGEETVARMAKRISDRFELELENHFELEEKELFPAIERHLGANEGVARLVLEHLQLRLMKDRLTAEPREAGIREFCALLREHIRFEENELFEQVQDKLPADVMEQLGAEFESRAVRACFEP